MSPNLQTDWEMYLGINTMYTWKNASSLWVFVKNMLKTDDVNVLQKVCRSRDLFYATLGQENYYHCINIYALMQYTSDWNTAAYYVRMWSHLDFMCNIGYQRNQFLITQGVDDKINPFQNSWINQFGVV